MDTVIHLRETILFKKCLWHYITVHRRLLILYFLMKNSRFTVLESLIANKQHHSRKKSEYAFIVMYWLKMRKNISFFFYDEIEGNETD